MNAFKQTKEKACAVEWRNALPVNLQQIENRFTTKPEDKGKCVTRF